MLKFSASKDVNKQVCAIGNTYRVSGRLFLSIIFTVLPQQSFLWIKKWKMCMEKLFMEEKMSFFMHRLLICVYMYQNNSYLDAQHKYLKERLRQIRTRQIYSMYA